MNEMNRRQMLKWSALVAGAMVLPMPVFAADAKPMKILFFTKSSGFQHSVIDRKGKDLAYAEQILIDLGKDKGFEVTASKNGTLFTPEKLAEFDAYVFYTTGDLTTAGTDKQPPMTPEGKQALLDAISNGKGFVGLHCASDTFHSHGGKIDPYIAMLGGEFSKHGAQQESTAKVMDTTFPGAPAKDLTLKEEWYALINFAPDIRVILQQQTAGMTGDMYKRDPYPSTWTRNHGKGKVFYSSLAHREDTWKNPLFTDLLLGGLGWVTT